MLDDKLTLTPFKEGRPRTFTSFLCDGLSARHVASFANLLDVQEKLQAERPEVRVLASLDDLAQACYTSGHSIERHDLDNVEGHDLSCLSQDAFENGEYVGHLSHPSDFPIRLSNLRRLASLVGLDQASHLLDWRTGDDANDLVNINKDADTALQIANEDPVLFLFVPVQTSADAIAVFPNGYFSCDLSPTQNYAVADHLEATYGLVLFGVGSRFLGFRRPQALDKELASQLASELVGLYNNAPASAAQELTALLAGRTWVLIRYTES